MSEDNSGDAASKKGKRYRVYDAHCDKTIVEADSLNNLFQMLFLKLYHHNSESIDYKVCDDSKNEADFGDIESSFWNGQFVVQQKTVIEKVEWNEV